MIGESSIPQTPWEPAADAKGRAFPSRKTKALSISSRQNLSSAKIIRVPGWSSVKHPKAGEGEAVKGTWNKWPMCVKGQERLCRESPFTAFPSEATFAVTDDPS
jgi:hypothetical protein